MKKYIYSLLVIGGILFTSCEKDFLDTIPTDQVSASSAVATTGNAFSLLNGIHRSLYYRKDYGAQGRSGQGAIYIYMDALGEDQVVHREQWFNAVYKWNSGRSTTDNYNRYQWQYYYELIANANILINGIDAAEGLQEDKNAIKGQALAYRAWCHYQLVQMYGGRYVAGGGNGQLGVPIKLNTEDLNLARSTVEEVYTQINADLNAASTALAGYSRPNKTHLNANVVTGLKARVALTQGNWSVAASMAAQARAGFTLMSQATYADGFRINSEGISEFMWASQIIADQTDKWGNFGAYMSRNFSSSAIRGNPRSINSLLYDKISATDVRKGLFDPTGLHLNLPSGVSLLTSHARRPYTSQKFIAVDNGDSRVDVSHMRAAEMYLIEAEALARQGGKDNLAAAALFSLVSTRDSGYTLSANTGAALIEEILTQRRVELWGEGFRYLDLKRLNLPLDRSGANHSAALANNNINIAASDLRWEWLIPQLEMDANPNMVQNPL
jgi:hypothetical protein